MACAGFFWRLSGMEECFHQHSCPRLLLLLQPLALLLTPLLVGEERRNPWSKSSAIWSLGNGDALSLSFPHGKWGIFHFINDSAESRVYQHMCNWCLLSALHLVTLTPVPGRVGIPGRLPVKSLLSWLWLAPSCVAYSWFVGSTRLGPVS